MLISPNCNDLGKPDVEFKRFPDGESYVKVHLNPEKDSSTFVHRCYPDQDNSIIQLIQVIDTLAEKHPEIKLVIPYMPYARQERRVIDGEAISTRAFLRTLAGFNVKEITTFNCHFMKNEGIEEHHGVKINNISLAEQLIGEAEKLCGENALVIGPDKGAKYMGAMACFEKKRGEYAEENGSTFRKIEVFEDSEVREAKKDHSCAIIVDDIIASGGTMVKAAKACRDLGFKKVIVACAHAQMLGDSETKLGDMADGIVASNTILSKHSKVDFSRLI